MSNELKIGNIYKTDTDQLKQIIGIEAEGDGTVKISYNVKSAKIPNRNFELGHNKTMPPSDETFKNNSGRLLTDEEIEELIKTNILKRSELI